MLIGRSDGKIDAKNRVSFPRLYRRELGETFVITTGFEKSLIIVSSVQWETLLEGTKDKPFIHLEARQTQRFLLGNAAQVMLDKKGRFLLPAHLKNYAMLFDEIVFLGMYRYVEAWDKKRWEEYNSQLAQHVSSIAQKLTQGEEK